MPFTPFHFGPGYLATEISPPRWFSFYVFAFSQVVIDCETLLNILNGAPRLHTFFHTFAGSLVAGTLTVLLYRPVYRCIDLPLKAVPPLKIKLARWRLWDSSIPSWRTSVFTAWIGAWSHVLFDAVDHSDLRPFAPWSEANPLHALVSSGNIYLAFFLCGVAALFSRFLRTRTAG